jgi:molybdate-binding protein
VAAEKADLGFKKLTFDRIDFLTTGSSLEKEGMQALVSVLKTWNLKHELPSGISMDANAGLVVR